MEQAVVVLCCSPLVVFDVFPAVRVILQFFIVRIIEGCRGRKCPLCDRLLKEHLPSGAWLFGDHNVVRGWTVLVLRELNITGVFVAEEGLGCGTGSGIRNGQQSDNCTEDDRCCSGTSSTN